MALTIFSSNRVETLQSRLVRQLANDPPASPFEPAIIVVPTYAMGRWLNLRIAQQQGIAANIVYPQLGDWVWSLADTMLGKHNSRDPYAGITLSWRIFSIIPRLSTQPAFKNLANYLDDDRSGIKRWQLSHRIATCMDRYQNYRPQMIERWSAGEDHHWQAKLWRELVKDTGQAHRGELIREMSARLQDSSTPPQLPASITLFALSSLPPHLVELVHRLASRTEILLYQHSPTNHYWADLVNARQQARLRLQNPRQAEYIDEGNSLLASWGRQGQAMQDLLLDFGTVTANEIEDNQPPGQDSLLHRLQGSLFELAPAERSIEADESLTVNICHSPMRECQVLRDHLLELLDSYPELASEDILVMVPEISRYAPYIEAVFQHDESGSSPNLGWNISDISVADGHPLVQAFLQLLKLPSSRFSRSEILGLLDCAEIRHSFGLSLDDVEQIQRLVEQARVRWGVSAAHREQVGLPAMHENTWQQAWERFFAGYAMPDSTLWQGIAPITDIDGSAVEALARFRHLFDRLSHWRNRLAASNSVVDWQQQLHQLLDEFFTPRSVAEDQLLPLRNAISELGGPATIELTPELVSYWLEKQFSSKQQAGRLYSGGITFCGMQPLRNIPFPVICVLGMQDDAFPRRDNPPEFDLMRRHWQPGDPGKGDEDRYLMLETLLCARRFLYFSYSGRSLKDNSECQPSTLLRELLDYIDSNFECDDDETSPSQQLTRIHPMQPFSARNFQPQRPGYDGYWYGAARQLAGRRPSAPNIEWPRQVLLNEETMPDKTELETMLRFYRHPIRFFFNTRLGIYMPTEDIEEDEEVFALQGLQKWALATRIVEDRLDDIDSSAEQFSAQGLLPHGAAAPAEWLRLQQEYRALFDRVQDFRDSQAVTRRVDCRLGSGYLLSGQVGQCYPGTGLRHFSASKSSKSRAVISLWLSHLALCASGQLAADENSQLITAQGDGVSFGEIETSEAAALLADYVGLFHQGLEFPLPVFPNTSFAWARENDAERATTKALEAWKGGNYRGAPSAESEDEFIRLALHGQGGNPLEDPLFQDCARRIYRPAIDRQQAQ